MQSDVRDREGILSCPLVFKHRASVLLSCTQDKPLNCFQPVSQPSADREKERTAIESNGTRRVYVFLIENQGKVLERRWWTHLQCEALAFCTRTMEIVSSLMDRWRGITHQFHFLPSIQLRLLRKEKKKTQCTISGFSPLAQNEHPAETGADFFCPHAVYKLITSIILISQE